MRLFSDSAYAISRQRPFPFLDGRVPIRIQRCRAGLVRVPSAFGIFGGRCYLDCCKHYELFGLISYGNYEYQGFDIIEPSVIRNDDLMSVSTRLTRTLTDHFSVFFMYSLTVSNSTVARQNFDSELYSLGLMLSW